MDRCRAIAANLDLRNRETAEIERSIATKPSARFAQV